MLGGNSHRQSWLAAAIALTAFLVCGWATGGIDWPLAHSGSAPATGTQVVSIGADEAGSRFRSKWKELESAETEAQNNLEKLAAEFAEAQGQWEAATERARAAEKTLLATASELSQIELQLPQINRALERQSSSLVDSDAQYAAFVREKSEHAAPDFWERAEESCKAKTRMQIYQDRMEVFQPKNFPAGARIDYKFVAMMAARDAIREVPRRWAAEKAALLARRGSIDADIAAMRNGSEQCSEEIARLQSEQERLAVRQRELRSELPLFEQAAHGSSASLELANSAMIAARDRHDDAAKAAEAARRSARQALAEFDAFRATQRRQIAHVRNAAM